jgi:hypothetical protein
VKRYSTRTPYLCAHTQQTPRTIPYRTSLTRESPREDHPRGRGRTERTMKSCLQTRSDNLCQTLNIYTFHQTNTNLFKRFRTIRSLCQKYLPTHLHYGAWIQIVFYTCTSIGILNLLHSLYVFWKCFQHQMESCSNSKIILWCYVEVLIREWVFDVVHIVEWFCDVILIIEWFFGH